MLLPFTLDTDGVTRKLIVGGQDLTSRISRVTVDCSAGDVTKLFLEVPAAGTIEGEGIVIVKEPTTEPIGHAIATWLGQLDAQVIESDVMRDLDMGSTFTVKLLERLQKLAVENG